MKTLMVSLILALETLLLEASFAKMPTTERAVSSYTTGCAETLAMVAQKFAYAEFYLRAQNANTNSSIQGTHKFLCTTNAVQAYILMVAASPNGTKYYGIYHIAASRAIVPKYTVASKQAWTAEETPGSAEKAWCAFLKKKFQKKTPECI